MPRFRYPPLDPYVIDLVAAGIDRRIGMSLCMAGRFHREQEQLTQIAVLAVRDPTRNHAEISRNRDRIDAFHRHWQKTEKRAALLYHDCDPGGACANLDGAEVAAAFAFDQYTLLHRERWEHGLGERPPREYWIAASDRETFEERYARYLRKAPPRSIYTLQTRLVLR